MLKIRKGKFESIRFGVERRVREWQNTRGNLEMLGKGLKYQYAIFHSVV